MQKKTSTSIAKKKSFLNLFNKTSLKNQDILFSPFQVNQHLTLKNRFVMAPMTRSMSPHHIPNDTVVNYYQKRAKGGLGLIITEGTIVCNEGHGYKNVPNFYGEALKGWKKVVDAVHKEGSNIFPQLWHCGGFGSEGVGPNPKARLVSPSGIQATGMNVKPKKMTLKDINKTIEAFALAAKAAEDIGFDGVEFHGAHAYLIDSFFWEKTNKRTDRYGGKQLKDRVKFAEDIIKETRVKVSPNFPICLRISQWKQFDFDYKLAKNPKELEAWLCPLAEAGVDLFHCSQRRFWAAEFPDIDATLNLAAWVKKVTQKPTITVGNVGLEVKKLDFIDTYVNQSNFKLHLDSISKLIKPIKNQDFDLVAVGRALISNPNWVNHIKDNQLEKIKAFKPKDLKTLL